MSEHVPSYRVIESGQVLTDREPNIWTHYDMEYHVKLIVDKPTISADGEDIATVTAKVYNYLDEPQSDFTGDIIFELDGETQAVQTTNGEASITVQSLEPGKMIIRTTIPNFRNGEIEVEAV